MVVLEEVGPWFGQLSPPKRLEVLVSLLRMCLPLELRFLATVMEELAQKDFYYLRDAENRANDPHEMKKLTDIFHRETRAKITTYLALLHSSSSVCSATLYQNLTHVLLPALTAARNLQQNHHQHQQNDFDNMSCEVLLLLTMAAHHPAFTFTQRQMLNVELHKYKTVYDQLSTTEEAQTPPPPPDSPADRGCTSPDMEYVSRGGDGTDSIQSASVSIRANGPRSISPSPTAVTTSSSVLPHASTSINYSTSPTPPTTVLVNNSINTSPMHSPVYVENVEVKGCKVREDRRSEFVIEVTWSDGRVMETCRTYHQLQQFHAELLKLFPKDAGAHKQERQIPFLPQDKGPANHDEMEGHIKKYIGQLSVLQDHIVKCDHVTTFFRSTPATSPTIPTSPSIPATPTAMVGTPPSSLAMPTPVLMSSTMTSALPGTSSVSFSSVTTSPLTITVESGQITGGHSPRTLPAFATSNSPTSGYSSSSYVIQHHGSPSSSGSSPLVSPSSSTGYPAIVSPRTEGIAQWLKSIRLHKYTKQLSRFSFEELSMLSEQQLTDEGMTVGARKKFTTEMIKWRQAPPNGLNFEAGGSSSCPQSPFHTPPHSFTASPPGELQHHAGLTGGNLSGVDSSSVGSECSSPPNSPIMHHKQGSALRRDSMSSDETDKDTLSHTEGSEVGVDGSEGLLPTPSMLPLQTTMSQDGVPFGLRPNHAVLGLPPGMREGPPSGPGPAFIPLHHTGSSGAASAVDIKSLQESMLHHPFPMRPMLHTAGMFDNCCMPPRGVPQIRGGVPHMHRGHLPPNVTQPIRTLPLPIHTTAATTPVMPSPKMPTVSGHNGAGIVFENGHHHGPPPPPPPGSHSFTYVPNHSHHGPLPPHPTHHHHQPPPLGALPHNHPAAAASSSKLSGGFTTSEGLATAMAALTVGTGTSSVENSPNSALVNNTSNNGGKIGFMMNSSAGVVPLSTTSVGVAAPVLTWPSSVTMANTSMVAHSAHSLATAEPPGGSNSKQTSPVLPGTNNAPSPPTSEYATYPPSGTMVTSTVGTNTMSTSSSSGSTYSTPPPPNVKCTTPPMQHQAPLGANQGAAHLVHHAPAGGVVMASASGGSSSCSSCGCHCNSSSSTAGTPTPTQTPPPAPPTAATGPTPQQQHQGPPPQQQHATAPSVVASATSMGPPPPPPPPPQQQQPPQAPPHFNMWYMQQAALWNNSHLPHYLAANAAAAASSNGLIPHGMTQFPPVNTAGAGLQHHVPPTINGLSTDILYHPAHNLWLSAAAAAQLGNAATPYAAAAAFQHSLSNGSNNNNGGHTAAMSGGGKKSQCYNCGQSGHWAPECKEPTMDAMTHSGTFHLKFRPKSQDAE